MGCSRFISLLDFIGSSAVVGTVGLEGELVVELAIFVVAFDIYRVRFCPLCEADDVIDVDLLSEKVLADQVGFNEVNFVGVVPISRLVVEVCLVVVGPGVTKVGRETLLSFKISIGFSGEVSKGVCTFGGLNGATDGWARVVSLGFAFPSASAAGIGTCVELDDSCLS